MLGGNPADILTRNQRIDAVTPAAVQETFKKYLPLDRYTVDHPGSRTRRAREREPGNFRFQDLRFQIRIQILDAF